MRKLFFILLTFLTVLSYAQDLKPVDANLKILQAPNSPIFYYNVGDSTIGFWKGVYKWNKLFSAKQTQHKVDSLAFYTIPKIASSIDNAVTRWDGTTGKLIQSSVATLNDSANFNIPTGSMYEINGKSIVNDAITDGITTRAPSQNKVFDELALKAPNSVYPATGLTAGYIPYKSATVLANSPLFTDVTNLGIGTALPEAVLHVVQPAGAATAMFLDAARNGSTVLRLRNKREAGTETLIGSGATLLGMGWDGTNYQNLGYISIIANNTVSSTNSSADVVFFSTLDGTVTPTEKMRILANGNTGFGTTSPTAAVHIKAGTATASTAPLKFTSGTLNTTAEAGAVEFLTDKWYGTITTGAARKTFAFLESPTFVTPNIGAATATSVAITGATSGTATIVTQAIASTPTLTLPKRTGTFAVVVDSIRNGVVASSPTENKVYDELALKSSIDSTVFQHKATNVTRYRGSLADAFLLKGTFSGGTITLAEGAGTRMQWNPSNGSFRAGRVSDTRWNNIAGGTTYVGDYSFAVGHDTRANFEGSAAFGENTSASEFTAFASGTNTVANGMYSFAANFATNANNMMATAFGFYNVGGGTSDAMVWTDPLFEIGNGTDNLNRANALSIKKNGYTTFSDTVKSKAFVKTGGLSTQFLMANGTTTVAVPTNLSTSLTSTGVSINSSTGTAADIGSATSEYAGILTAADKIKLDAAEPSLGNPATTGHVLSSTTAGARSWVANGNSKWQQLTGKIAPATVTDQVIIGGNSASSTDILEVRGSQTIYGDGSLYQHHMTAESVPSFYALNLYNVSSSATVGNNGAITLSFINPVGTSNVVTSGFITNIITDITSGSRKSEFRWSLLNDSFAEKMRLNHLGNLILGGSVRVNNDSESATVSNVGAIRYRSDANNSYCEMVMQTGASTYSWVVIKQNTW